jgi:polysaccharide biosynthesis protein PslJ
MRSLISDPISASPRSLESDVSDGRKEHTTVAILTLYLFLLMAIPVDLVFSPLGAAGSPSTMFALLVFVIYFGMWLQPSSFLDRGRQPIRLVAVLFTCVLVASYASANRNLMPVLEKNSADRGLIFMFGWLGVLLLAADGIESVKALRTVLRRQVSWAVVVALLGVVEFFTRLNVTNYIRLPGLAAQAPVTDLLVRGGLSRIASTTSQPIEFGAVIVMTIPFALHQARFSPPNKRAVRWLQVAILVLTAPLSVSRSAVLSLIAVAIVILPTWSRKERRSAYIFIGASLTAFFVFVPSLVSTLADLIVNVSSDSSAQSRTDAIAMSWSYISQNPWLGRGFSTFLPQTYFFVDDQYLTSLITTGFIGLLALVVLFIAGWAIARSTGRAAVDAEGRHLAQCLAASVVVAAISFSDYDALGFPMASGLTFMVLGCCGAYWRLVSRSRFQANVPL